MSLLFLFARKNARDDSAVILFILITDNAVKRKSIRQQFEAIVASGADHSHAAARDFALKSLFSLSEPFGRARRQASS